MTNPLKPINLRDPQPGDYGWIIHKQGLLYANEYGWDVSFEALVAEIIGKFSKEYIPGREKCWVAVQDGDGVGKVVGSIFIVRQDDSTAKLRLLYVDPAAQGQGLGRRMVNECIQFAKSAGYQHIVLWTNDNLHAARHIYETAGFKLITQEKHHSFGKDLVGQNWKLDL
ncbi:MAG TPA: GNAT family N-acetyltransferase [Burkholderiaceae bacterium]|nr:GNAT family N-acetyltransferase [Burkholderiaceae bacterium]